MLFAPSPLRGFFAAWIGNEIDLLGYSSLMLSSRREPAKQVAERACAKGVQVERALCTYVRFTPEQI
jgi:hypothetical protein